MPDTSKIMEVKKQVKDQKLSYEELSRAASELHMNYQKLQQKYMEAVEALRNREFEYTSFFLQMLFKVLEHPEQYTQEFVDWSVKNIEGALQSFADSMTQAAEENVKAAEKKIADEA